MTEIPKDYYYRSRPGPTAPVDWTKRIDPDGKVRVRAEERDLLVADTRDAVAFLCPKPGTGTRRTIADLGCGFGFAAAAMMADGRTRVLGVEPDANSAAHAAMLGVVMNTTSEAIRDAQCDGALSWNVLEHVTPDPLGYLREAARIVRVGGWLVLQTPNFDSEAAREWGDRFRMLHDETHVSLFGETGLRRALRDTGWIVREMRHDFLRTRFNTDANNARLAAVGEGMSPAAIGNVMTAYCQRAAARQAGLMLAMGELERSIG